MRSSLWDSIAAASARGTGGSLPSSPLRRRLARSCRNWWLLLIPSARARGRLTGQAAVDYVVFVRQGDRLHGAVHSSGSLIESDPTVPLHDAPIQHSTNPRELHAPPEARDLYGRPHAMLAHPDGEHLIISGNAARVLVGGGMLIYNVRTGEDVVLTRERLIPDQGVVALAALPDGDIIVATTTAAATGGTATATEAILYRLDMATRRSRAMIVSESDAVMWPPVLSSTRPAHRDLTDRLGRGEQLRATVTACRTFPTGRSDDSRPDSLRGGREQAFHKVPRLGQFPRRAAVRRHHHRLVVHPLGKLILV